MAWMRFATVGVLLLPAAWVACSSFEATDNAEPDGGVDASPPFDDGGDGRGGDGAVGPEETSFTDLKNWQTYSLKGVGGSALLNGGVYDSVHSQIYFSAGNDFMVKYDTTADFTLDASWLTFDVTMLPGKPRSFDPGVIGTDGLLYLPAGFNAIDVLHQVSARFDPMRGFQDPTAWETFSTTALTDGGYAPFSGSFSVDGGVTFLPYDRTVLGDGDASTVLRAPPAVFSFGANAAFGSAAAWRPNTTLLASAANGDEQQFTGAAVVGDYVYTGSATTPQVARIHAALDTPLERYSTLEILPAGSKGVGSFGTITDGRYVYFTPCYALGTLLGYSGQLIRYDTTKTWGDAASYELFDLASLDVSLLGFASGTFDGRFVYFVGLSSEKVVRFDTTKLLSDHSAYEIFALATIKQSSGALRNGAVFDGQYVYIVPSFTADVFRFKAKTARAAWPNQASSF